MRERTMHPMRLRAPLLLLAAVVACDNYNPVEVRSDADQFPLRANWSASAVPVGTAPGRATLAVKQYLGFRMDASLQFTGAPNTSYQWRIFRGDCTISVAAVNNTAPTGLLLFATLQSYPDVLTNAAGSATVSSTVAGSLDSLTAYSVRARVAQTATSWNGTSPVSCGDLQRSSS